MFLIYMYIVAICLISFFYHHTVSFCPPPAKITNAVASSLFSTALNRQIETLVSRMSVFLSSICGEKEDS